MKRPGFIPAAFFLQKSHRKGDSMALIPLQQYARRGNTYRCLNEFDAV